MRVQETRKKLRVTQAELGQLLGVHPLTISKWERGVISPPARHVTYLTAFESAAERDAEAGRRAVQLLAIAGIIAALAYLFALAIQDGQ